ncbi:MAG: Ig-like domain-containing protein [Methanobacterium sp.]|nr:Ig-like domain-containing protein [Methanobacterium sp.]
MMSDFSSLEGIPVTEDLSVVTVSDAKNYVIKVVDIDNNTLPMKNVTSTQHGKLIPRSNDIVYLPDIGFTGNDSSNYTVSNKMGVSNIATVNIGVKSPELPTASNIELNTMNTKQVEGYVNLTDIDGDPLKMVIEERHIVNCINQTNGTVDYLLRVPDTDYNCLLEVNKDGHFVFTPDPRQNGNYGILYKKVDILGRESNLATICITINHEPLFSHNMDFNTTKNGPMILHLNTTGGDANIIYNIISKPRHGTLIPQTEIGGEHHSVWVYIPNPNYTGNDSFTYNAICEGIESNMGTVNIHIDNQQVIYVITNGNDNNNGLS